MHALYDLKEMLCAELEDYGKRGELSTGSLEIVDKLAHTIKNLDKIIDAYENDEEYSSRPYNDDARGYSYEDDRSYARGRGRYAKRDNLGRYSSRGYSRNADITEQLRNLMDETHDDKARQEIQRLVTKMEHM